MDHDDSSNQEPEAQELTNTTFLQAWVQLNVAHQRGIQDATDELAQENGLLKTRIGNLKEENDALKLEISKLQSQLVQERIPSPGSASHSSQLASMRLTYSATHGPTTHLEGPVTEGEIRRIAEVLMDHARRSGRVEDLQEEAKRVDGLIGTLLYRNLGEDQGGRPGKLPQLLETWREVGRVCAEQARTLRMERDRLFQSRSSMAAFLVRKTEEWRSWRQWHMDRGANIPEEHIASEDQRVFHEAKSLIHHASPAPKEASGIPLDGKGESTFRSSKASSSQSKATITSPTSRGIAGTSEVKRKEVSEDRITPTTTMNEVKKESPGLRTAPPSMKPSPVSKTTNSPQLTMTEEASLMQNADLLTMDQHGSYQRTASTFLEEKGKVKEEEEEERSSKDRSEVETEGGFDTDESFPCYQRNQHKTLPYKEDDDEEEEYTLVFPSGSTDTKESTLLEDEAETEEVSEGKGCTKQGGFMHPSSNRKDKGKAASLPSCQGKVDEEGEAQGKGSFMQGSQKKRKYEKDPDPPGKDDSDSTDELCTVCAKFQKISGPLGPGSKMICFHRPSTKVMGPSRGTEDLSAGSWPPRSKRGKRSGKQGAEGGRGRGRRSATPDGFWDPDFPPTQPSPSGSHQS